MIYTYKTGGGIKIPGMAAEYVEHFWIASFASLMFVASVSPHQVTLVNETGNGWYWRVFKASMASNTLGWIRSLNPTRYQVCDVDLPPSNPQPDDWLISDQISIRDANRIDITVDYFIKSCSNFPNNGGSYCVDVFGLYVNQSDQFIVDGAHYPDPRIDSAYERVAEIKQAIDTRNSETINLLPKGKYIILAIRNYGACGTLYSVVVTYNVCPDETLNNRLVSLPRTAVPVNESNFIQVEGNCTKDAIEVPGSLFVHCEGNGEWNTTGLEGRCICKEDMQNNGGICEVCPGGTYNDEKGLNCTSLPSAPRNVTVTFVNQSAVEIRWLPPVMAGDQTRVHYDVSCHQACVSNKTDLEGDCERNISYMPNKEGLNATQVMVTDLSPSGYYSFKIYAKNRVSEVAKRRHSVEGSFIAIVVRTNGSTPATTTTPTTEVPATAVTTTTPTTEVSPTTTNPLTQVPATTVTTTTPTTEVSPTTTNPITQASSTTTTSTTEVSPATTTANPEADSKTAVYLNIIYGFVGIVGFLTVVIVSFACYKIFKRCRGRQAEVKQNNLSVTKESETYVNLEVYDGKDYVNFDVVK